MYFRCAAVASQAAAARSNERFGCRGMPKICILQLSLEGSVIVQYHGMTAKCVMLVTMPEKHALSACLFDSKDKQPKLQMLTPRAEACFRPSHSALRLFVLGARQTESR
jgi:hypothetical protein